MSGIDLRISAAMARDFDCAGLKMLCRTLDAEKQSAERERIAAVEELGLVVLELEAAKKEITRLKEAYIDHLLCCPLGLALAGEKGEKDAAT